MIKEVHGIEIMKVDDSIGVLVVFLLFAFGTEEFIAGMASGMETDHGVDIFVDFTEVGGQKGLFFGRGFGRFHRM